MMNKKLTNKKVIKALTIGLSLAMASQPITALAAEPETTPEPENNTMPIHNDVENGVADAAQEQADETWKDVKEAEASAVVAVEEAKAEGISEEVKEAAEALGDGMEAHMEGNVVVDAPETDIEKAAGVLGIAEGFAEIAQSEAVDANKQADITIEKAKEAVSLQTQAETIADEITTTVNDAQTLVNEKAVELNDAGSVEEVKEVFDTIEDTVKTTDAAVEKAASDLSKIEDDFNKANEALEEATREYENLVNGTNGIGNSVTAFDTHKGVADKEAAEAKARVDELAKQAEDLKNAAEAAKAKYEGIQKLKDIEDKLVADFENDKKYGSGSDRIVEYFTAVIQYYYIPEIADGKFISIERNTFTGSNFLTDDAQKASTKGDVLNYYEVKYEKDGVEQTLYLNYKLQNQNTTNDQWRWQGLVIFEKTEHQVVDGHDIENLQDDGNGILTYGGSSYVKEDNKYYKLVNGEKQELTVETQLRNDNWYSGNIALLTKQDNRGRGKDPFVIGKDLDYKTDNVIKVDNKNWILDDTERNTMLGYRNALANSAALALKYASIAEKAAAAQTAFEKAQADVVELQTRIEQVAIGDTTVKEVATLQASLETAKTKLEAAKTVRDNMVGQLEDLRTVRDNKIAALTPAPATGGAGETTTTDATGDVTVAAGVVADVITPATPAAPAAPAAGGAGTVVAPGVAAEAAGGAAGGEAVVTEGSTGDELTDINGGRTALASALDEETAPEVTAINEGKAPLAYAPINEESMSWWWWLIVALLGATGYAMYKKHQEKKAEKVTK